MLRVLHVLDSFQLGGTEWQSLSLARHLDPTRFRSFLVTFTREGPLLDTVRRSTLPWTVIPFPSFRRPGAVKSLSQLAALMRRERIQIVQAYGFYSNVPALLAGRLARVPILIASRRDMGQYLSRAKRLVEKGMFRMAERVVVNAEAIRDQLVADGEVEGRKIVVIPSGVDLDRFDRFLPAGDPPLWARKGKVVAMVARFRKQKDHATLLRAAEQVLAVDPTVIFALAGDGYLREQAEQLAEELGIAPHVCFVGAVDPGAMPAFLHHVDISVLVSKGNEGTPNVVLESMAAGKPVVATDTGGCREAIRDGVSGFLVPPGDPGRLAARILELLQDEIEAARMGKAGRQRVEAEFALPRMIRQFSSLYIELARQRLGRAVEVG